jgi:hypothetical protein
MGLAGSRKARNYFEGSGWEYFVFLQIPAGTNKNIDTRGCSKS